MPRGDGGPPPDDDILQQVTGDELQEVYSLLEKDIPTSLHVLNFIKYYAKKEPPEEIDFKVFCPSGDVKSGIVIACAVHLNEFGYKFTMIHCDSQIDHKILGEVLMKSKLMNRHPLYFATIEDKLLPILSEVFTKQNVTFDPKRPSRKYILHLESYDNFRVTLPADVHCRPLTRDDVPLIDETWDYHNPTSHHFVRHCVMTGGGVGLTLGTSGQLVAWAVNKLNGIGILFTVPQYRKRGYAALMIKLLCQQMIRQNIQPFATINENNSASIKLFTSLGFQDVGIYHYVETFL